MDAPLGMVAGAGDLPVDLAHRARSEGRQIFVVRLRGLASSELEAFPGVTVPFGRFSAVIGSLKKAGCVQTLFSGKVLRPRLSEFVPDWLAIKAFALMLTGVWRRDDALLRVIAGLFEREGISVVGPADIWPQLLAGEGLLGACAPTESDWRDIRLASVAALRVGATDRGQGAIARHGLVIAVEDRQHTQGLLRRAGEAKGSGGVLVKLSKPHQDRRLDLPVIGPETIAGAVAARLSGIVVEAGGVIVTRSDQTISAADEAGIFLIGVTAASANA